MILSSPPQEIDLPFTPTGRIPPLRFRVEDVPVSSPLVPEDYLIDTQIELHVDKVHKPTGVLGSPILRNDLRFNDVELAVNIDNLHRELGQEKRAITKTEYYCIIRDKHRRMKNETYPRDKLDFATECMILDRCDLMRKDSNQRAVIELRIQCKITTEWISEGLREGGLAF
jgi:hypothetical protein